MAGMWFTFLQHRKFFYLSVLSLMIILVYVLHQLELLTAVHSNYVLGNDVRLGLTRHVREYPHFPSIMKLTRFKLGQNPSEKREFLDLIRDFDSLMKRNNLTYMLYSGSLIGAHRHHGLVPWDDDYDVLIPQTDLAKLRDDIFANGRQPMNLKIRSNKNFKAQWKIFRTGKPSPYHKFPWRWPFVDIWPSYESKGHIYDSTINKIVMSRNDTYPIVKVPFDGLWLPAPRHMEKLIRTVYGDVDKRCKAGFWNHRRESGVASDATDCENLQPYLPFVKRECKGGIMNEQLKVGSRILHEWKYDIRLETSPVVDSVHENCLKDGADVEATTSGR